MINRRLYYRLKIPFFYFMLLFSLISGIMPAQPFVIDSGLNITHSQGNNLFVKWSPDGQKIVYQSDRNGNWDIFLYDIKSDSTFQLTSSQDNEQHPVWYGDGQKIVFDSDKNNTNKLYILDRTTGQEKLLINRDIRCREAVFSQNDEIVFFSGFDVQEKKWEIYSYEFFYNNLNLLNDNEGFNRLSSVSPQGDDVLILAADHEGAKSKMIMINWYGNILKVFNDHDFIDPVFGINGLKIYFISTIDDRYGEVYSFWKDGSHLQRLTDDSYQVRCPALSPDGTKITLSVKIDNTFDIFLIPLEEY